MFIGHFAVGFGSKKLAPRASLGALMIAPMLSDLLWPVFLLVGVETVRIDPGNTRFTPLAFDHYPWSHSLAMAIVWAAVYALGYFAVTRYAGGACVIAAGVVSHWVLDFVTHRPDMPLYPGGPKLGLSLWDSVPATVLAESMLLILGLSLYTQATQAKDRIGSMGFWLFVVFVIGAYIGAIVGTPPPNVTALAISALTAWLIPLWAWWFDRHRVPRL